VIRRLLELDGEDLRRMPIETRKLTLKSLLRGKQAGIVFNAHFIADGAIVYRQACALGCEGIVSKRLGSPYRSGRTDCWLEVKNPNAPAVKRERFRSRTPGPPPFSSMNPTPADSNARRIAKSLALVSAVWFSFSSARRMVATLSADAAARSSAVQRMRERAALI
jgi:hypothetical protein